jgi:exopolysaccharide biosynthesis WecB/TagA/CpsF family protein
MALVRHMRIMEDADALRNELALLATEGRQAKKPVRVAFVNAHAINLCYKNPTFLDDLLSCEYVYRDGSGMKILFKMLGMEPGINMNGTDLIPQIIESYHGCDVALLGTKSPYLENAAQTIADMNVTATLMLDGFRNEAVYAEAVNEYKPTLAVLAMGMPKQERVADRIATQCDAPCLVICGGAIVDFLGGKVTRAPAIFRSCGMEWLYRLLLEPRRLFRRYMIGNAIFLLRAAWLMLRKSQ